MKAISWAAGLVLIFGLTACGSDEDKADAPKMPDVVGRQLDDAKSQIKDAGFDDDVDVDGGGTFGIVDESNWKVCNQVPAAGSPIDGTPKLTVDRGCDDGEGDEDGSTTTEAPSTTTTTALQGNLTVENSPDLAALLKVSDPCDDSIVAFADKYVGRTIEFDGSIVDKADSGNGATYDFLLAPGDDGPNSTTGPAMKFADTSVPDLKLTAESSVNEGDRFHFIAKIREYIGPEIQCLLYLDPVSTIPR